MILTTVLLLLTINSMPALDSGPTKVIKVDLRPAAPDGMAWIEGGSFQMGGVGEEAREDELPRHEVSIDGFFIDVNEVTNRQFKAFIDATGYVTVAERPVDWEQLKQQLPPDTPKPTDELLAPGSLVFAQPDQPVDLNNPSMWWRWTSHASWKQPQGPDSTIDDLLEHPVVHVSHEDATAYCRWANRRLPTEAQWEFASRGGLEQGIYSWGDDPIEPTHANIWQGRFPNENTLEDGYLLTAPVGSFPANGYGLHDMAGNVWEWCQDRYRPNTYTLRLTSNDLVGNPTGPTDAFDPRTPHAEDVRVHRGGSFLCNAVYCDSYRPSARMATTPDTGMSHLGFRTVATPGMLTPADAVKTTGQIEANQ